MGQFATVYLVPFMQMSASVHFFFNPCRAAPTENNVGDKRKESSFQPHYKSVINRVIQKVKTEMIKKPENIWAIFNCYFF